MLEAVRDVASIEETTSLEVSRSRLATLLQNDDAPEHLAQRVIETIGLAESEARVDEGFAAISRFFEALGRDRPVVVVFDDIHWGEATFLDLVEHLADWSRGGPILLLCMARPELLDIRPNWAGGKLNATSLLLEPLSETECTELVANLVGEAELAEEVEARIAEAAEGNPLFVEEMLSMLIDDGLLVRANGRWTAAGDLTTVPVPPTIHALLAARLDQLGHEERAVIERAAVEGKLFHRGSIEELSIEPLRASVATHLGALVRKELIRPERPFFPAEDGYRFRHLLIRDAAYETIPKEVRAELHERHVDWLATKTAAVEYDEIAGYHLEQAFRYRAELRPVDDRGWALGRRAAERLGAAGRRAFQRGDASAGANLVTRAVDLLSPEDPLRVELVPNMRAIQGEADLGWVDRILTHSVEAAATTGDRRLAAHALVQRGLLRLFTDPGQVTAHELVDVAERAIDAFEELGDDLGLARALRLVAQAHYLDRRLGASAEASERALDHARRAEDRFEESENVEWLLISLLFGPSPARAGIARCRQLLAETNEEPELRARVTMSLAWFEAADGNEEQARRLVTDGLRAMEEHGQIVPLVLFYASTTLMLLDDWAEAETALRRAYEPLRTHGRIGHFGAHAVGLAMVSVSQGRYDEAQRFLQEADRALRANDVWDQIHSRATEGKILARLGDLDRAETKVREAIELATDSDLLDSQADVQLDLGEVLELGGRRQEAAEAIERSIALRELKGNVLAARRSRTRLKALS